MNEKKLKRNTVNIARYYKQERLVLDCEIITPMFLGNSAQEAELRAAPFKGLLRYWWRVARGSEYDNPAELLDKENRIFGGADADTGRKSKVTVEVKPLSLMTGKKELFKNPGNIDHPECERNKPKYKTNPLAYLAGMGLIHYKHGILHSYFPPGAKFRLSVTGSRKVAEDVRRSLGLLGHFASIGSRSRNGWGCFAVEQKLTPRFPTKDFPEAFEKDYPHCLGRDTKGDLWWRLRRSHSSWEYCMKELADVYVTIRAGKRDKGIQKMPINSGSIPDRHLLGYPVTNHPVGKWGRGGRHGSALRLLVRKENDQYRGYILHLPHLFSKEMWPEREKERQIQIWRSVHQKLDTLCERVAFGEESQ